MAIAIALPTLALSRDERDAVEANLARLTHFEARNRVKAAYYDGKARVRELGISIPPSLQSIETVVGWPGIVVDVLEERLDWLGWTSDDQEDPFGLGAVYRENSLDVDSGLGHLDSLIYGTSFVAVGSGFDGEPQPLITVESPRRMTGTWDARLRRLSSAFSVDEVEHGDAVVGTLYLPDQTIRVVRGPGGWAVADRDEHRLGRVPVAVLPNRPRASRLEGRSEITRPIRSLTDQGVRTLLGMEVNREFYSAPQRYAMGVGEDAFVSADGSTLTGWEAVMGRMLALPRDEDGELPVVGQFNPVSPTPYLEQIRGLAQMISAEGAFSADYLGFVSDNPSSADAIRAGEARLVKRAERRQTVFGRAWREVAYLALLVRDGSVPAEFSSVTSRWRDAATPTRAAAADEVVKLIGAGVLLPESTVTMNRIGLTPAEQRSLAADRRRARGADLVAAIRDQAPSGASPAAQAAEDAAAMKARFDALGAAVRSGVDPEDAAARLGLSGLRFTGATPVSLRQPEAVADDLEER